MNEMFWKHEYLTLKEVEIPKLMVEFLEDLKDILENKENYDYDTFGFNTKMYYKPVLDKLVEKWEKRAK